MSYEYRPIDDCSASGLNLATITCEKMLMHGLETLLVSAHEARETFSDAGGDGVPIFAKGDHGNAYRQWPVHEDDHNLVVALCGMTMSAHMVGSRCMHTEPCSLGLVVSNHLYHDLPGRVPYPKTNLCLGSTGIRR